MSKYAGCQNAMEVIEVQNRYLETMEAERQVARPLMPPSDSDSGSDIDRDDDGNSKVDTGRVDDDDDDDDDDKGQGETFEEIGKEDACSEVRRALNDLVIP